MSRPRLAKGSSVSTRPVDGSDDEDDETFGGMVRRSVEMEDHEYQSLGPNPVSQAWSFGETSGIGGDGDTSDQGSNTVQVSSEDEGIFGDDNDVEMKSTVAEESDTEGAGAQETGVVEVAPKGAEESDKA